MRPSYIISWLRSLKPSRSKHPILGVAWYREDQWPLLRQVSVDSDKIEPTWEEWKKTAEAKCATLESQGAQLKKVTVDVADMAVWCRELGRVVDGPARAAYVVHQLQRQKTASQRPSQKGMTS